MSVAKMIELSADHPDGFDEAIEEGRRRAAQTVDNLRSLWIKDQEIILDESGGVDRYRVHLKATFLLK